MITLFRQGIIEGLIDDEGGRCRYCRVEVRRNWMETERHDHDATIDHIVPKAKGGGNERSNYALACRRCNNAKGDRSVAEFKADPRSESQRKRDARKVKAATVQKSTQRGYRRNVRDYLAGEKPRGGTLAAAISRGEVDDAGRYRKPSAEKLPPPLDWPWLTNMMRKVGSTRGR